MNRNLLSIFSKYNLRKRAVVIGLICILISISITLSGEPDRHNPSLADLINLDLDGYQRLLVLAPHSDDETLGAAGLIYAALNAGMEVKVVLQTNGDGYLFATMEDFRRLYPQSNDFIRMGYIRQQETLQAMQVLGLRPQQVIFLSYPDRGTPSLWNTNWSADNPFRSPYSGKTKSPYPLTYNPASVYSGESLLKDLRSILNDFQPDLIAYPHTADVHPDHWGLGVFTQLAIAMEERENPQFRPDAVAYLVHRPNFPQPRGLNLSAILLPPPALFELGNQWYRLDLSDEAILLKTQAVQQYLSQLPTLRKLLESFIRTNELFEKTDFPDLPVLATGDPLNPLTWIDPHGDHILPLQKDPVRDFITRKAIPAADLTAVYAARRADFSLQVCAEVKGGANPFLAYSLRVTGFSDDHVYHHVARNTRRQAGWHHAFISRNFICDQVMLSVLGDPWLLFIGADVEELGAGALDQTAWRFAIVDPIEPTE